jgi:hypothetical protein
MELELNEVIENLEYLVSDSCTDTQFDYIEEIEIATKSLKKQIPKKPIFSHNLSDTLSVFHCECRNIIKVSHNAGTMNNNNATNYCSKCGCKLDWSDKESEETKL